MNQQDTWLDALGIERWVPRNAPAVLLDHAEPPEPVPTAAVPRLSILCTAALSDADHTVLDKMLAAIGLNRDACVITEASSDIVSAMAFSHPTLVLVDPPEDPRWASLAMDAPDHLAIAAHPRCFADRPALKRPAWEALKRIGRVLDAD